MCIRHIFPSPNTNTCTKESFYMMRNSMPSKVKLLLFQSHYIAFFIMGTCMIFAQTDAHLYERPVQCFESQMKLVKKKGKKPVVLISCRQVLYSYSHMFQSSHLELNTKCYVALIIMEHVICF